MKLKLCIWIILICFSLPSIGQTSNSIRKVSIDNYPGIYKWTHPHIIDEDRLLLINNKDLLNKKIDSISKDYRVRVTIFLFANADFSPLKSSQEFVKKLHHRWYGLNHYSVSRDSSIIIAYNHHEYDFVFYKNSSLASLPDSIFFAVNKKLALASKKSRFYSQEEYKDRMLYISISDLLSDIRDCLIREKEFQLKQNLDIESENAEKLEAEKLAKARNVDIWITILFFIGTLVGLYWVVEKTGNIAIDKYSSTDRAGKFLKNRTIRISLLFVFVYPMLLFMVFYVLCAIFNVDIKLTKFFFIMLIGLIFLGWLPTSILFRREKRRVIEQIAYNNQNINIQIAFDSKLELSTKPPPTPELFIEVSKVDINAATFDQIEQLSKFWTIIDIKSVIQERDKNGYFKDLKDLEKRTRLSFTLLNEISKKIHFVIPDVSSKKREDKRVIDL